MDISGMTNSELAHEVERLRSQEGKYKKYQHYFQAAGTALVMLNEEGDVDAINRKACQLLGYQEDELLGKNWFHTCVPESSREWRLTNYIQRNAVTNVLSDPHYVGNVLTKSGSELTLSFYTILLVGEDGKTKGIITSVIEYQGPDGTEE